MSSLGPDLHKSLLGVQAFFRQCSRLLQAADAHLLDEENWALAAGSQALVEVTYSLNQPQKWLPEVLFRWYRIPDRDDVVAWVSILLVARNPGPADPRFDQPLVTTGWVQQSAPLDKGSWGKLWRAKTVLWTHVARDGTWHDRTRGRDEGLEGDEVRVRCRALPLVAIDDADKLVTDLLGPLVADITAHAKP